MRSLLMAMSTGPSWPRTRALRMIVSKAPPLSILQSMIPKSGYRSSEKIMLRRDGACSGALQDVQAAAPVDQIDQAVLVEADVVALHPLGPWRNIGHERRHFFRRVWIGDV